MQRMFCFYFFGLHASLSILDTPEAYSVQIAFGISRLCVGFNAGFRRS